MLSPATPSLNRLYQEDGLEIFLVDFGDGTETIHLITKEDFSLSRMKHLEGIWMQLVIGFWERGMDAVDTWVEFGNAKQTRFAEFFGFELTGFLKNVIYVDGSEKLFEEMRYQIPDLAKD